MEQYALLRRIRSIDQIETEVLSLVPARFRDKINVQTIVVLGDPVEELLYQGRIQHAKPHRAGALGASRFAAVTCAGIVYKVLAFARCPVITLSPVVLAECGACAVKPNPSEVNYVAGVI